MNRILVVEDDADILLLFGEAFADTPWQVVPCRHDERTLARLQTAQPDAVLLDIRLDGPCNGWELLHRIKAESGLEHVPVMVCTGSVALTQEHRSWLAAHHIPLIDKPFELDQLEAVVRASMDRAVELVG